MRLLILPILASLGAAVLAGPIATSPAPLSSSATVVLATSTPTAHPTAEPQLTTQSGTATGPPAPSSTHDMSGDVSMSTASSAEIAGFMADDQDVDYTFPAVKQIGDITDADFLTKIADLLVLRDGKYMPDLFWDNVMDRVNTIFTAVNGLDPSRVYQLYLLAGTKMMELLMNTANADLKDSDMQGSWQDRYQQYVQNYYNPMLKSMCFKNSQWFTCTNTQTGASQYCPFDMDIDHSTKITFTLKSDDATKSAFNNYINSTVGLSTDVINMQYLSVTSQYMSPPDPTRMRRGLPAGRSGSRASLNRRLPPQAPFRGHPYLVHTELTLPGLQADYPPKIGIVMTNFTNSAGDSLKSMNSRLASGNTNIDSLHASLIQVMVRTQSGNDTLDQFYQYKDWVEQQKEIDEAVKNMIIEIVVGTLVGGLIDFGIGLIGEAVEVAAEAISAAKTVTSIISKVSKAFEDFKELPAVSKLISAADKGIQIGKGFLGKVWDVLPKNVQNLLRRIAPKLEDIKAKIVDTGCDQLSQFVGLQIPPIGNQQSIGQSAAGDTGSGGNIAKRDSASSVAVPKPSSAPTSATPTQSHGTSTQSHGTPTKTKTHSASHSPTSSSTRDDCIFGMTSTKQIRGVSKFDDYKFCYCYHETTTANSAPNTQVWCPGNKKLQTKYLAPNPLFNLGGYEKNDTLATCNHVWELSELVAFTAMKDANKTAAMCQRINEVYPKFNSEVREFINGPQNLEVLSASVADLKHQIFIGNVTAAFFDDASRYNALKTFMSAKTQAFLDIKTRLGTYFASLESSESHAKPNGTQLYFTGITSKFFSFFDGGIAKRADLMTKVGGVFQLTDPDVKTSQVSDITSYPAFGIGNITSYAGDFLSQATDKAVNVICRKLF
ncbi:hypothetical protein GQ54DRAFT_306012 [Martensiomyces pterosporus]|nr:hypothetical protein GQ54DRAFT_306012 [Martensiomyces pterosporus]